MCGDRESRGSAQTPAWIPALAQPARGATDLQNQEWSESPEPSKHSVQTSRWESNGSVISLIPKAEPSKDSDLGRLMCHCLRPLLTMPESPPPVSPSQ